MPRGEVITTIRLTTETSNGSQQKMEEIFSGVKLESHDGESVPCAQLQDCDLVAIYFRYDTKHQLYSFPKYAYVGIHD